MIPPFENIIPWRRNKVNVSPDPYCHQYTYYHKPKYFLTDNSVYGTGRGVEVLKYKNTERYSNKLPHIDYIPYLHEPRRVGGVQGYLQTTNFQRSNKYII